MYEFMNNLIEEIIKSEEATMGVETKRLTEKQLADFAVQGKMTGNEARDLIEKLQYC